MWVGQACLKHVSEFQERSRKIHVIYFSGGKVRVVRFYKSYFAFFFFFFFFLLLFFLLLLLAGPQLPAHDRSGQRRAFTASAWSQWAVLDLYRKLPNGLFSAWPLPQAPTPYWPQCCTSTARSMRTGQCWTWTDRRKARTYAKARRNIMFFARQLNLCWEECQNFCKIERQNLCQIDCRNFYQIECQIDCNTECQNIFARWNTR